MRAFLGAPALPDHRRRPDDPENMATKLTADVTRPIPYTTVLADLAAHNALMPAHDQPAAALPTEEGSAVTQRLAVIDSGR